MVIESKNKLKGFVKNDTKESSIMNWKFLRRDDDVIGAVIAMIIPEDIEEDISFAVRTGLGVMDVSRWTLLDVEPIGYIGFRLEAFVSEKFNPKHLPYDEFFKEFTPFADYYYDKVGRDSDFSYGSSIFEDMDLSKSDPLRKNVGEPIHYRAEHTYDPNTKTWTERKYEYDIDTYVEAYTKESELDKLRNFIKEDNERFTKVCTTQA